MTTLNLFRSVCLRATAHEDARRPAVGIDAPVEERPALIADAIHPAALLQPLRRCGVSR